MASAESALNAGQPNVTPAAMQRAKMGDVLSGLVPRRIARTGLTSAASHVEPEPGMVSIVAIADDASLSMIEAGTAGAGEVLVEYDAEGVATLTFGDGAQTAYRVVKQVLPAGFASLMSADLGQAL